VPAKTYTEREICVREIEALLRLVRQSGRHSPAFIKGIEAARNTLAKPAEEPWHGTVHGYNHYKCRRKCCRDAMSRYRASKRGNAVPQPAMIDRKGMRRCSECRKFLREDEGFDAAVKRRTRRFCSNGCFQTFTAERRAA
jgi:hypothetical protein